MTAGYDAVVIGGGHNALVAAGYLGRAGKRVIVLERLDHVGGAAVSARPFNGVDAKLSRYSYLVSLFPRRIIEELGLPIRLARRRYSAYSPDPATGGRTGLLVDPHSGVASDFYRRCRSVTAALWPTMTEPLRTRSQARTLVGADADWAAMIEQPVGHAITAAVADDAVRGLIATDALIGTFARLDEDCLRQNVCFLYHLIGGDWQVPIGGMGAVTEALLQAARCRGVEVRTGAEVLGVDPDGEVRYRAGDLEHRVHGRFVLAGVTPTVLAGLLGEQDPPVVPGSQVKVNLMLRRLPRLRDRAVTAEQAFAGTVHVNETYSQLEAAYARAAGGDVPDPLPCEIYCHSLTDPSILSASLRASGAQTLTVFGLHTPHGVGRRGDLADAVLESLNSVLAEPIQDVVMPGCMETKTTDDLERALGMTAGNIFHGALTWPFAEDDEPLDTPARRWGVSTGHERVLLCGAGARRGGGVSGIGGHNAAMAVLSQ
ncbi:MAG: NAD(P)/FAD-dependent oxidoreductase [Mycobacteriaceae bacterium]|nr:NAD(P)/FAD-dependent oxidoreductase [Mycobacteriaceae bacterium]